MSLSRPGSAQGLLITTLSQNKVAPKWTIGGRGGSSSSRPSTPGPGSYSTGAPVSRSRNPAYGFGTSSRDGMSAHPSPGPGAYAQQQRPRSAGPCFGSSRRGLNGDNRTPGLGSYNPNLSSTRFDAPRYTATPRRGAHNEVYSRIGTPGPGHYTSTNSPLHGGGKNAPQWGFGTSHRNNGCNSYSPGPGAYNSSTVGRGPAFSMRCRSDHGVSSSQTPGPGAFGGMYTQFGY
mmetsp:Transcript_20536/g.36434  ORF Transcript_20536/g.36434 Transcript_20536/m.36434 type:complete len:232 (-) Transcript_20536:22-717(-)